MKAFIFSLCTLCFLTFGSLAVQNSGNWSLLGTTEFPLRQISSIPKWVTILKRIKQEEATYRACDNGRCATPNMKRWRDFIQQIKHLPVEEKLRRVNRFANKWPYKTDNRVWGKSDYWATPMEFMKHSGDCEDYSIFKYVTLKAAGVSPDHIRLVVVKDTVRNLAHAVLAVYTPKDVYILDSLFDTPLPHGQVLQYSPYYSINETTRWTHAKKGRKAKRRTTGTYRRPTTRRITSW